MKEQTPLLYPLTEERETGRRFTAEKILNLVTEAKRRFTTENILNLATEAKRRFTNEKILILVTEAKRRFSIKKVLMYALLAFFVYDIIGMVEKRLWWRLNTSCTWERSIDSSTMNFTKCFTHSLECRQYCANGDQECHKRCYDLQSSCYEAYHGWYIPQIEKCETSYKLVFEL